MPSIQSGVTKQPGSDGDDHERLTDVNEAMSQRSIRRWPWVVSMLLGIAGAAAVVLRARRLSRPESEWPANRPVEPLSVQYSDQLATGRSPTGNGVVGAQRPSNGID